MSLDRLINLARRTGDRLIVHQPDKGNDVVIMDVDEYEVLFSDRHDVRNLSDKQLLDQINRDIAIWRANDKLEAEEDFEDLNDIKDEDTNWFSTGNILGEKFNEMDLDSYEDNHESDEEPEEIFGFEEGEEDLPTLGEMPENTSELVKKDEPKIIPEKPVEGSGEVWEEESLGDDEPVFYEEPV